MDDEDLSPVELETECIKPESVLSVHTQPNVTLKQNYDVAWKSSNGELDALVTDDISLCRPEVITGSADSDENLIEPDVSQDEAIPDIPEKQERDEDRIFMLVKALVTQIKECPGCFVNQKKTFQINIVLLSMVLEK